jgi:DNA-binding response OmpR family regulator
MAAARAKRLCFLVIETEPAQGLSTRKLLIETAKHNVITAYSGKEGMQMFDRFPNIDAVVIDSQVRDMKCEEVSEYVKGKNPHIRVIALSPRDELPKNVCNSDRVVLAHDPAALLSLLEELGAAPVL